jgi:hypothetical protein
MNKFFLLILPFLIGCQYKIDQPSIVAQYISRGTHKIQVQIDSIELINLIEESFENGLKKKVTVLIDTILIDATLQVHGGTSRLSPKKSFRITFDDPIPSTLLFDSLFVKDVNLETKSVVLNAATRDYSRIRNAASMYASKLSGAKVPKIGFHSLYINNIFYGLYSTIERVDDDFINSFYLHKSYDLLKAQYWAATLFNGEQGFEIKNGSATFVNQLSEQLVGEQLEYEELLALIDSSSISSFILGHLFTDEDDSFGKNYYLLYLYLEKKLSFFRWDSNATFGRTWNGEIQKPTSITERMKDNALLLSLSQERQWKIALRDRMLSIFNSGITDDLIHFVNIMEQDLTPIILMDYQKWGDLIHDDLVSYGWDHHWDLSLTNSELLASQFNEIREFINNRESSLMADLNNFIDFEYDDDDDN